MVSPRTAARWAAGYPYEGLAGSISVHDPARARSKTPAGGGGPKVRLRLGTGTDRRGDRAAGPDNAYGTHPLRSQSPQLRRPGHRRTLETAAVSLRRRVD